MQPMSCNIKSQLERIVGSTTDETMTLRVAYMQAYDKRETFLEKCRNDGLKGKAYSSLVAAYDAQNMKVFN
jgi:diketogulonate reductase-like aldo/keto reductase